MLPMAPVTVDDALSVNEYFSMFHQALKDSYYSHVLNSSDINCTLFVPTNAAMMSALTSMVRISSDESFPPSIAIGCPK